VLCCPERAGHRSSSRGLLRSYFKGSVEFVWQRSFHLFFRHQDRASFLRHPCSYSPVGVYRSTLLSKSPEPDRIDIPFADKHMGILADPVLRVLFHPMVICFHFFLTSCITQVLVR
jgi:hypothetical protein